ncbi:MAG TPA: DHH family phosphoesterase, partial [Acidiferrobacterales bacterium]|nr:DHH family phosphoesterase [Acidiferrobacterales bacterium]
MDSSRRIVRRASATAELSTDLHPVLARLYAARAVQHPDELDLSLERLLPPDRLKHMDAAVALLAESLRAGQRILIVADFDADGATSCALAVRALRSMGAHDVRYVVPNRFEYGYGLTPEIVAVAAQQQPDLLITVDNGISSVEGVR